MLSLQNTNALHFMEQLEPESVHLIVTDPPYIISKDSGMDKQYNLVQDVGDGYTKTEADWLMYKEKQGIQGDEKKENYMRYGSIYGKKYAVKTQYGEWDSEFTMQELELIIEQYYKKLKKGGTLIMFFDLWKIGELKTIMENYKFKQLRFIEWIKTNPQPRNSSINYLTNCREIALMAVKGSKPTFHSKYDNGIYHYPLQGGKGRFHPTQKNLEMIKALIEKHSNEGDVVLDTFLGSGTTALACRETGRTCFGCEVAPEYFAKMNALLDP